MIKKLFVLIIALFIVACATEQTSPVREMKPSQQVVAVIGNEKAASSSMTDTTEHTAQNQDSAGTEVQKGNNPPNQAVKEVTLTASQWKFEPSVVRVNLGETIKLKVRSIDVEHGVGIREFNVNVKVPAGEEKEVTFVADQKGEFSMFCNVYCGAGHKDMKGVLVVE